LGSLKKLTLRVACTNVHGASFISACAIERDVSITNDLPFVISDFTSATTVKPRPSTQHGRPDVVFSCKYLDAVSNRLTFPGSEGFYFFLDNFGEHPAVNVSILPVTITIPERIVRENRKMTEEFGELGLKEVDTEWIMSFMDVDMLAKGDNSQVRPKFRIQGLGPLQQNIAYILPAIIDTTMRAKVPMTVRFSNLGEPQETWHAHYELDYYYVRKKEITCRLLGYGECNANGTCPRCKLASIES
jgi:hypothetical protein